METIELKRGTLYKMIHPSRWGFHQCERPEEIVLLSPGTILLYLGQEAGRYGDPDGATEAFLVGDQRLGFFARSELAKITRRVLRAVEL